MCRLLVVAGAFFGSLGGTSCAAAVPALEFFGVCDGSAAVALDDRHFAIASDETSVLRVYDSSQPGPARQTFDLTGFLQLDRQEPETDLEAAARVGDRIYWITSHGRTANAKVRTSRQRFFATRLSRSGDRFEIQLEGRPYKGLLADLAAEPRLAASNLAAAARRAPEAKEGLAIEGLCDTPDGRLLIGFRNPVRDGQALIVPLLNPDGVIRGERAKLGDPITLDLGGLGVRDLLRRGERYLVMAGPYASKGAFRCFSWPGPGAAPTALNWKLPKSWTPEALVGMPMRDGDPPRVLVLSDDGGREIGDCKCKEIENPSQRRFRGAFFAWP